MAGLKISSFDVKLYSVDEELPDRFALEELLFGELLLDDFALEELLLDE